MAPSTRRLKVRIRLDNMPRIGLPKLYRTGPTTNNKTFIPGERIVDWSLYYSFAIHSLSQTSPLLRCLDPREVGFLNTAKLCGSKNCDFLKATIG